MAGTCEICGKHVAFGHNVSFSKRRTNRTFHPNIQKTNVYKKGKLTSINACTRCIRTLARPDTSLNFEEIKARRAK